MPLGVHILLYLIAFLAFGVAAFFPARSTRLNQLSVVALGLAAWVLVPLLDSLVALD